MRALATYVIIAFVLMLACSATVAAQSNQFGYQGSLNNAGTPANGNYDFEFALFDALNAGNQIGSVQSRNNVGVTNGVFAVRLDFGAAFPGAARYLEIRVRTAGQPGITILTPRQPIDSSPYAIKSLTADAANAVGGQTAVSVANAVLAVNSATQASTPNTLVMRNANGDFAASTIVATQQYNINANRVLGINGSNNIFVGVNAGLSNTGNSNAFFGSSAGQANTSGSSNSFFGRGAGRLNTMGSENAFFGAMAGDSNTTADFNAFFGSNAGAGNTTGDRNSFFGAYAGAANMDGIENSFFGTSAGRANTTGVQNSFFGRDAGRLNTFGFWNTFVGYRAGASNENSIANAFFGHSTGAASTGGDNAFFGASAGSGNTTGTDNSFFGRNAGNSNLTGNHNTIIGNNADVGIGNLSYATAIGAGAVVTVSNLVQLGREDLDNVRIGLIGGSGSTHVCVVANVLTLCSSSLRYKQNVQPLTRGLDLIAVLRPVRFDWKNRNETDLGLIAEEVAEVEPLLVTRNKGGEIEGVKYDRVGVVLVNAVKEQQAQIEAQAGIIRRQQQQIDALRKLVCATNAAAEICKGEPK